MAKKLKILQLSIVLLFLGAFLNVYITNTLCNVAHYVDQTGESHTHPIGHDHHNHSHNTDHNLPHSHGDEHSHNQNSEDNNCCNDLTSEFISDLDKLTTRSFKFEFTSTENPIQLNLFSSIIPENPSNNFIKLVDRGPPLLKPSIVILFQSLLI